MQKLISSYCVMYVCTLWGGPVALLRRYDRPSCGSSFKANYRLVIHACKLILQLLVTGKTCLCYSICIARMDWWKDGWGSTSPEDKSGWRRKERTEPVSILYDEWVVGRQAHHIHCLSCRWDQDNLGEELVSCGQDKFIITNHFMIQYFHVKELLKWVMCNYTY